MDTSEEYIEMCRKAEEIQHDWKFKDGDYIFGLAEPFKSNPHTKPDVECWSGYSAGDWPGYPQDGVWLPRQDQLQDMVGSYQDNITNIYDTVYSTSGLSCNDFTSMEQLWLAIVMDEKYGKRWDGTDWVV